MKIVRLSKKEYRKRFGMTGASTERYRGTEPTVYLPGRASTKEILHEIYHATKSPELEEIEKGKKWTTPEEVALEEVRAQDFAAQMVGKKGILWNQVLSIVGIMLYEGYKPNKIFRSIVKALEEEDYEVDDDDKSFLWGAIRGEYAKKRGKVIY